MGVDDSQELRVKFFTRSYTPGGAEDVQNRVLDRLETLCEQGVIKDCDRQVWGKRVCTSNAGTFGEDAIETVAQFRTWADRNDASLLPFFDERTCHSKITGEEHSEIVFPMMCMAVYRDDDLVGVYPHADGESVTTIQDCLASLSAEGSGNADRPERTGATLV